MITDINRKSRITTLNAKNLNGYWCQYFDYEKDVTLCNLTRDEFLREIAKAKKTEKPFIDSQIIVSKILTNLGNKHTFHRQFNERFPKLHKEQVLGMQLYKVMIDEPDLWIYHPTQHSGHLFQHATYFMTT
ncbi:MAG: hypothetical protein M0Q12_13820 [Synergistaceae bacterium]|jgi:hypothetical protein|nr:hypothetical protein [Synergistaceae bacterium]MDD4578603.1 hypothetical protein [Anaerolineaceae bacterium]